MPVDIALIQDNESGLSVRTKLNQLIAGAKTGDLGLVTPEDVAAMVDFVAPGKPTGLTITSVAEPSPLMTIMWDFAPEDDFAYYDLQIKQGTGSWIGYQTSSETYPLSVLPNTTYSAKLRAVDKSGNASPYCDAVVHVTAKDTVPPAMPIGVEQATGLDTVWLKWIANTESDFARYEIYESDSSATPDESATPSHSTVANNFVRAGLPMETTHYFWVRAVDSSENVSPWSAAITATTGVIRGEIHISLNGVVFQPGQGTGNRLMWSSGSISYGHSREVPTVQAIPSGQVEWTTGTVYVRYIPGDASITTTTSLVDVYANDALILGVYKGGIDFQLVEGKAYTDGGLILAQTVGANQLVANAAVITGTAQIKDAIISDAKITELDAKKLFAENIASNNVLVGLLNGANTKILPGQILISGGTSLSTWIDGGDNTLMNGGYIAANTIALNSAVFGMRGLDIAGLEFEHNKPGTNYVAWSAGTITYTGDDGNTATRNIPASYAQWTSGTLYLYYTQGGTNILATTDAATANTSNNVILATYQGDRDLVAKYGRTVIDGLGIKTGSITAAQADIASFRTNILVAGSVSAGTIAVSALSAISANMGTVTAGIIQSPNGKFVITLSSGKLEWFD